MNSEQPKLKFIFTLITSLIGIYSFAADRFWIGNGTNKNWNTTTNWSATSGGASGASVPGSTDDVYLNGGGLGQLILDVNITVRVLTIESTYSDTLKQNGKSITTTAAGMIVKGGVFLGNTGNILISGPFTILTGAKFISTSSVLTVGMDFTVPSDTNSFKHNKGTVRFTSSKTISGHINFYDLHLHPAAANAAYTFDAASIFNVEHLFKEAGDYRIIINTGTINVKGDISQVCTVYPYHGTGLININGGSNQTIAGPKHVSNGLNQGGFCNVKINKPSGILYLKDVINVMGTWDHINGAVDDTSNLSEMSFPNGGTHLIKGTQRFNQLWIGTASAGAGTTTNFNVNPGDTLTVGSVHNGGTGTMFYSGYINITGNFLVGNTGIQGGGTGTITFIGNKNQLLNGQTVPVAQGMLCTIKINKTGGTLKLKNNINVKGDWNYINGNVDAVTDSSLIYFPVGTRTISGKHTLNNLLFYTNSSGNTNNIPGNDTITLEGRLAIQGTAPVLINGGTFNAKGLVINTNTSTGGGGTAYINICGNGYQELTGNATLGTGRFCNIAINKSGTLRLKNCISLVGHWIRNSGTLDALTDTATVAFCNGTRNITGGDTFYKVYFNATGSSYNTIPLAEPITVLNNLVFTGTGLLDVYTGTIHAKGNIYLMNSNGTTSSSFLLHVSGEGNQYFVGHTHADIKASSICNVDIDKPSGTLYMSNKITLRTPLAPYYWKYTRGNVDAGNSTVGMNGNFGSFICVNSSNHMSFNNVTIISGAPGLATDFYLKGTLTLTGTLNANNYTIYLGGDFYNAGTFDYTGSTVVFNGNTNQYITGTKTSTFQNLAVNKPSGKLYLNYPTILVSSLILTKGVIVSSTTNYFYLNDNCTSTPGSNLSYVAGMLAKRGNDAFTFALGDTTLPDTSAYHPFSITAPANISDVFSARYFAKNQLTDHPTFTTIQSSLKNISTCEYWSLTGSAGASVVLPTLHWNKNSCNTALPGGLRVAGWDGSQWKNMGQSSLTGTASQGSITAVSPGINATVQYYVIGRVPLLHAIDSRGLDSLSLPDTLKYTISGSGLTGTYAVGALQDFYPDLPATGSLSLLNLHLQTKSNQAIDLQLELTSLGTTQNPKIIVPVGSTGKPCSIAGCVEVGNPTKLNECLLKNCFKLSTTSYVVLKQELDGGYFRILNGDFRFKFDEAYHDNDGKLSYRLYDETHKLLVNTQSLPAASQYNSEYGSRCYAINLMGCYDNIPFGTGYYVIEVENSKKEVWTARIKNFNLGVASPCGL